MSSVRGPLPNGRRSMAYQFQWWSSNYSNYLSDTSVVILQVGGIVGIVAKIAKIPGIHSGSG